MALRVVVIFGKGFHVRTGAQIVGLLSVGGLEGILHDSVVANRQLLRAGSRTWPLGAITSLPLLDGGRSRAEITRSEAAFDEAAGSYRQTVLAAFAEFEDDLANLHALSNQANEIDTALAAARRSASLAESAYRAGAASYLELLDAQRSLASVERNAIQLLGERAAATVALVRAGRCVVTVIGDSADKLCRHATLMRQSNAADFRGIFCGWGGNCNR